MILFRRSVLVFVSLSFLALTVGWYASKTGGFEGTGIGRLKDVRFWAYQIQNQQLNGSIEKLAESDYDLLVIDQIRSLKGDEDYDDRADVSRLKQTKGASGKPKIVLCYIDVGEAESYRWYWRDGWQIGAPDWIIAEDPDGWDENYPVKVWAPEWRRIMEKAIDRIIADGYDGIYLDWLEGYSFGPVKEAAGEEGLDSQEELIDFVTDLARYARSKKPDFIFMAQNAAELGRDPAYVRVFDAIAQEAIWYDGSGDPDTGTRHGDRRIDPEDSEDYLDQLGRWSRLGRPVFDVEYAAKALNAHRAYRLGTKQGFKTYVALRPLAALTENTPPGY